MTDDPEITFTELYSLMCDAVYRGAHDLPRSNEFFHTSDVSRRTANIIMDILETEGLLVGMKP